MKKKDSLVVYGKDYETYDGTCIRDFVHVSDLVEAHVLALKSLLNNWQQNECYNVGNQRGYSIKEVIKECENVTGRKVYAKYVERREGDPPKLISSSEKIIQDLRWAPKYSLKDMIESAWKWYLNHPNGYKP